MNMRKVLLTSLALLLVIAFAAQAEVIPFDAEVGYRWLSLDGNQDMYRSQVNERSGFLLRTFTLSTGNDGSPAYDRLRVDGSDLGVGPAGALRIDAEKSNLYHLRVRYRRSTAFSALPAFANPLLSSGIVPGQHTYNRLRTIFDADVEFLPGGVITPFIGYSLNRNSGPGTTTYHVGQDEFLLDSNLNDVDKEYRIGSGFNFGPVYGQLTQGWRRVRTHETANLALGAANGNEPGSILEQPQTVTHISRDDYNEVKTPFFNGFVTGQYKNVRMTGNYVRFAADASGDESESVVGQLASFALTRFFTGLTEGAVSDAKNHTWRGGARAEYTLMEGLDFFGGWQRERRELEGTALINSLYAGTVNFAGVDPRDVATVLNAKSTLDRDEDVSNFGLSAKAIGPLAFRAEYRVAKQDVSYAPDLEEIVVPGSQSGNVTRRIKTWDVSSTYLNNGVLVGAAWHRDNADRPVLRTDYLDRDRLRLRAAWTGPKNLFRIGVVNEELRQMNNQPGINYDSRVHSYTGDLEVNPVKVLTLHASLTKFASDSTIETRLPQNFFEDTSLYTERGKGKEGGFSFFVKKFTVDASYSRFENQGGNPFVINRTHVRVTWDVLARTGLAAEFDENKYRDAPAIGNFDAKRMGIYLHFRP